jgi:Ca2+:H+ antiporter
MRVSPATRGRFSWTVAAPLAGLVVLVASWGRHPGDPMAGVLALFLVASVLAAVHHAEVVAHRVGEPLGSLVLAVAVTVIEVALILTLMLSGSGKDTSTLARDTVFSAVMITTAGVVGISLLVAAWRHGLAHFNPEGSGSSLASVITLASVTLVLPTFTTSTPGPEFSASQLAFAAVVSVALYALFVFTQTVKHRDFFLPVGPESDTDADGHADPPSSRDALVSLGLLVISLVAVVGLSKVESAPIERGVAALGFPPSSVGVAIALIVLLPESIAAVRAAAAGRTQISLNLAYGSAMASIGLTIPCLALVKTWISEPLALGLEPMQIVLLAVVSVVSVLTVVPGRAKTLNGGIHLVLLAAFLFLSVRP